MSLPTIMANALLYNTGYMEGLTHFRFNVSKLKKSRFQKLLHLLGLYENIREWRVEGYLMNYKIDETIRKIITIILREVPEARLEFGMSFIWSEEELAPYNNSTYEDGGGSSDIRLIFKSDADEAYFIAKNNNLSDIVIREVTSDASLAMTP